MIYIAFLFITFLVLLFTYFQWRNYYRDKLYGSFEHVSIVAEDGFELEGLMHSPVGFNLTLLLLSNSEDNSLNIMKELLLKYSKERVIVFTYRYAEDETIIYEMIRKHYGDFQKIKDGDVC